MTQPGIGKDTIFKLRRLYRERWNRDWPESNSYLLELWLEARVATNAVTARVPPAATFDYCLATMREDHNFDPGALP